jgi:hypothetical protein
MLGNTFRRITARKGRVNKKQKIKIDSSASSGGQGKYMKYGSFACPPLQVALPIFKNSIFV